MAAIGLAAVLAASTLAFTVLRWIGAGYLIWLGIRALRSAGRSGPGAAPVPQRRPLLQGALVSLLNPKVAIFFLAFLPQFVVPGAGPAAAQLVLHGTLFIAIAALVEIPLVLVGDRLGHGLRRRRWIARWLDRALGTVLIALGLRLALQPR